MLNNLWTPLFFGGGLRSVVVESYWALTFTAKQKEAALADILALAGTVIAMTVSSGRALDLPG